MPDQFHGFPAGGALANDPPCRVRLDQRPHTAPDDANANAAKANLRTFKLTTFDNKTLTIAMGRKPEEKKLKPPAATTDGKTGPAALGSVADLAKKPDEKKDEGKKDEKKDNPASESLTVAPRVVK